MQKTNLPSNTIWREIADILLAVNRAYNKSDYIPCIAWGRNARFSQNLEVGTKSKSSRKSAIKRIWEKNMKTEHQK